MAAKKQKRAEPIKDELDDARQEIEHVRDQLDSLAIDIDSSSAPQTHEQWRRCLKEIAGGGDWRNRTWK